MIALRWLSGGNQIVIYPDMLSLSLVTNTGVAFGMFSSCGHVFTVMAFLASSYIIFLLIKRSYTYSLTFTLGLLLLLSGALGNMVDRIAYGAIIDFIQIGIWPVFNFADICITCGCILIVWDLMRQMRKEVI